MSRHIDEGLLSVERQRELFYNGRSRVINNLHLIDTAVDVVAYYC